MLVELRHTRRFWPLLANSNQGEFKILAYSAPPTTEPITTDTEFGFFGTCTSGGRARVDFRLSKSLTSYASVGRYATWSERLGDCGATADGALARADRNDVWDPFIGLRTDYDEKRSHVNAWTGIRFDQAAAPFITADGRESEIFYRESYLRYDWLHTLSPTWALQNQGFHRLRAEYESDARPWREGEHYLAANGRRSSSRRSATSTPTAAATCSTTSTRRRSGASPPRRACAPSSASSAEPCAA